MIKQVKKEELGGGMAQKVMDYKFKTKPYGHQITALEKSWNKETYAYFMEMGTGKTKVLIDNLAMLYDKGKVNEIGRASCRERV